MSEEYNGWTNRETWALSLHLDQTQEIQQEIISLLIGHKEGIGRDDALKDWVEVIFEDVFLRAVKNSSANVDYVSMVKDVGSLWRVDWTELTDGFKERIAEELKD